MIVSRKAIPRRTMLRGMGAMLGLPLMESMVPALTAMSSTPAKPVNRFGVFYVPNGMIMKDYLPATEGAGFEITPTLSALAPFRDQILVLSGLNSLPKGERTGGAHAKATTRFLTDVTPPNSETWLDAGISMDQILAKETGKQTQLASLELAIENGETAGACDTGFACPYTNTISWTSASTPLPTQNNPRVLFERLFGDSGSTNPKAALARLEQQKSVLDSVTEEVNRLRGALPQGDRLKLTEYLEAVRGVERRIQVAEETDGPASAGAEAPGRHPGKLGRPSEVDVRFADAGVSMRSDPGHHLYGGARTQRHDLPADRRARCAPSHFASCAGTGKNRKGGEDQCLSRQDVRLFPGKAAFDAGWRRHAPRPHDNDVRRRNRG